ncbi:MAG: hypothetical protein ACMVY4_03915 [Minwuia sp.]|uniref:hypothetical protein n=1 Tax=Minwuia sp. TaxID=2493630 RepID=UPI003A8A69E3
MIGYRRPGAGRALAAMVSCAAALALAAGASAQTDQPEFAAFTSAPALTAEDGVFFQIVASNGRQVLGAEQNYPGLPQQAFGSFAHARVKRLGAQSYDTVPETYLRLAHGVNCPSTCYEIRRRSDEGDALLALTHEAITSDETRDANNQVTRLTVDAGLPAWYRMTDGSTRGESAVYSNTAVLMLVAHPSKPDRYVIRAYRDGALTDQALRSNMPDNLIFNYQKAARFRSTETLVMSEFDPADAKNDFVLKRSVGLLGATGITLKRTPASELSFTLTNNRDEALVFGGVRMLMNRQAPQSAFEGTKVFLGFSTRLFERVGFTDRMDRNKVNWAAWNIFRPGNRPRRAGRGDGVGLRAAAHLGLSAAAGGAGRQVACLPPADGDGRGSGLSLPLPQRPVRQGEMGGRGSRRERGRLAHRGRGHLHRSDGDLRHASRRGVDHEDGNLRRPAETVPVRVGREFRRRRRGLRRRQHRSGPVHPVHPDRERERRESGVVGNPEAPGSDPGA